MGQHGTSRVAQALTVRNAAQALPEQSNVGSVKVDHCGWATPGRSF
jgi:hypothetical protein